jgi:hypothetical protein
VSKGGLPGTAQSELWEGQREEIGWGEQRGSRPHGGPEEPQLSTGMTLPDTLFQAWRVLDILVTGKGQRTFSDHQSFRHGHRVDQAREWSSRWPGQGTLRCRAGPGWGLKEGRGSELHWMREGLEERFWGRKLMRAREEEVQLEHPARDSTRLSE